MKKTLIAFAALAAFGAAEASYAQNATDDTQLLISQIQTDKRAVVLSTLQLTDAQVALFTPIYDQYEAKVKPLQDRLVANINNFAEKYDTLSDADATAILKEKMAIEKERDALKQEYTKKIEKVLPGKKALRYAQLETRIQILIARDVYGLLPLAR